MCTVRQQKEKLTGRNQFVLTYIQWMKSIKLEMDKVKLKDRRIEKVGVARTPWQREWQKCCKTAYWKKFRVTGGSTWTAEDSSLSELHEYNSVLCVELCREEWAKQRCSEKILFSVIMSLSKLPFHPSIHPSTHQHFRIFFHITSRLLSIPFCFFFPSRVVRI